jgi:arylsulfatase A-like enzyme
MPISTRGQVRGAPLLIALLICLGCTQPEYEVDRVILVTLDTVRADFLPAYGYPRPTAPFFSRIASEGILFESAQAASSHTGPAHASLFTSTYPLRHGVLRNGERLAPEPLTMAEMFSEAGFNTAAFVSVDFLNPLSRGFRYWSAPEISSWRVGQIETAYQRGRVPTEEALTWVHAREPGERFFLWLHLYDAHEWHSRSGGSYDREKTLVQEDASNDSVDLIPELLERMGIDLRAYEAGATGWQAGILEYEARLRYLDRQIERLFQRVEGLRLPGNTLWILTADHGEGMGSHHRLGHGEHLYNEQLNVPLVFRFSSGFAAGFRVSAIVRHIDLLPTLAELVGSTPLDRDTEGVSIWSELSRRKEPRTVYSFAQRKPADRHNLAHGWTPGEVYSLQTREYKYIHGTEGDVEFYDLRVDPLELDNRGGELSERETSYREQVLDIVDRLQVYGRGIEPRFDDQYVEVLRALGYL